MKLSRIVTSMVLLPSLGAAAEPLTPAAPPPDPPFNRVSTYEEVTGYLEGYAAAYPDWVELESIGKSIEGRDMWLLTLNNPATGPDLAKPAMYVDGNIHANEVQGTEAVIYTIDFLLESYGRLDRVSELLDRAAFYFVPMVNPDGRARWFAGPSTAHFPRTVMVPVDDDRDGLRDEDGYDDLDGDGVITLMRKEVPLGEGGFRLHPKDPRILVEVEADELGDYVILGPEGHDNDGDGRVNEDAIGYVDPNRTWGYDWQPEYVQNGAGLYPLAIPETRSIALWALGKPNVAAAQSFHNSGKMILRGPGAKSHPRYPRVDLRAYDLIGEEGVRVLPGYRYLVSWRDLYTTYGATDDHFYRVHGAITFTNELYEAPTDLDGDGETSDEERMKFNDVLTLGRQFVPWKELDHPQYGKIEVGGFRQDVGRIPEGWMLEEETHRNAAFVLFHAHHLPKLAFGEAKVKAVGEGLWRLEITVVNERAIPSVTEWARQAKVHRVDVATVEGARVVASGLVDDGWLDRVELQDHRPERLMVPGVDGVASRTLFFLLEGKGEVTVRYDSLKGGKLARKVTLR
ncbi:MAG TPA: M14 family metallopeptidase [Thermoanaerobaculia bacterium]|jgi:hypothetical protein